MKKTKIAFIASECQPFFTSGGLGEVIGSLPKRLVTSSENTYDLLSQVAGRSGRANK